MLPWFGGIAVIYLFVQPKYLITYTGFRELSYSDFSTFWIIIGGLLVSYVLFELIPGVLLSRDYYKSDQEAFKEYQKLYSFDLRNQIHKIECISSYIGGIGSKNIPGAIHSEYWYYKIYVANEPPLNISRFLAKKINLVNLFKEEPSHIYTLFPSIQNEKTWVVREKIRDNAPSEPLIKRFEKKYENYSETKLESIVQSKSFRKEAKIAAKNLLDSNETEA